MKITRDNYEAYFLDYLEGNLPEELVNDFIEFLQQHPALKEELRVAGLVILEPEEVVFYKKDGLLKNKYDKQEKFDTAAVALLEGDLKTKEKKDFLSYLEQNPLRQTEALLFEKTRLVPDQNIIYTKKRGLYRNHSSGTILLWATRIAAVLVIGFLGWRMTDYLTTGPHDSGNTAIVATAPENITENPEPAAPLSETEIEQDVVPEKEKPGTTPKKAHPKSQPTNSLQEPVTRRTDNELLAETRIPASVPERIGRRDIVLASVEPVHLQLVKAEKVLPDMDVAAQDERLLGQVIMEKTGIRNLSFGRVAQAGLNLVANISGEKFSYSTNSDGQITELNYDSRLLAFSIPTNKE